MTEIALLLLAAPNWCHQCSGVYAIMIYMRRCLSKFCHKQILLYGVASIRPNGWGMARTPQVEVVSCVSRDFIPGFVQEENSLISWDQLKLWAGDMNNFIQNVGLCCKCPHHPPTKKTPKWKCGGSTSNNSQSVMPRCFSQRLWREIWLWPPSHDQKHPRRCFSIFVASCILKMQVSLGER